MKVSMATSKSFLDWPFEGERWTLSFVIIFVFFLKFVDGYPSDGKEGSGRVYLDLERRFVVHRLMSKDTKLDNGRPRY